MKKVILSEKAGFCFGVKKSFDKALELSSNSHSHVYTYGQLIHNEQAIEYLSTKGVNCIENEDYSHVNEGDCIVIRAHGIPEKTESDLRENAHVIDCTCPLVKKIHKLVRKYYDQGFKIVIVGNPQHPEIIGINGWCYDSAFITRSPEDIPKLGDKICIVSQTTENVDIFNSVVQGVKDSNPGALVAVENTICPATSERQKAVRELSKTCDAVVVIGGKKSSNTKKLFQISKEMCEDTYLVSEFKELHMENFKDKETIGVAAGASTPDWIIEEVIEGLKNI